MRTGFVTCVEIGLACMEGIEAAGGRLDCVLTLRDDIAARKSGRVYLDGFCAERGIELAKIRHISDPDAISFIRKQQLDWLFIIGWSQIASPEVLATPRLGVLGAHPTLLPVGRGRAAVPWAILKQLPETGVTFFKLDNGVDTGPILLQERITISPRETARTLYGKVSAAHKEGLRKLWPQLVQEKVQLHPQDESAATYWPARRPEDGEIRPGMTVEEIDLLVRAVTRPYPGAFLREAGRTIRIWSGRIADPTAAPEPGSYSIPALNGVFEAVEYDMEPDFKPTGH